MRKPSKEKLVLILELGKVFRAHGYHGTTISMLTKATELERASLYYYFPEGKLDMAKAVLLNALEELKAGVVGPLADGGDAKKKLNAMLKALDEFYAGGEEPCFVTIFSILNHDTEIQKLIAEALTFWGRLLGKVLSDHGVRQPKVAAQNTIAGIQGSLVLANAVKDSKIFRNYLRTLKTEWNEVRDLS